MKRLKLFLENFLVYGLGSALGKLVPFIMLPIITRLLPEYFYGLSDQVTLLVNFGSAIAVMGMYDAMFRLFFDKEDEQYKKEICSSSLAFTFAASVIVSLILMLLANPFSKLFFASTEYLNLIAISSLSILFGATNSIISAPTRMQNQRLRYIVINIVGPIVCYALAIPLIIKGWYLLALPLAHLVSVVITEGLYGISNKKWFKFSYVKKEHFKPLMTIGLPLMPNILIYWVFSACDKLMITHMMDMEAVGVYAAAGKIGQISNLIYLAFAGGWQYFAFSTMKDDDQVKLTSNVFEYLGAISFMAGIFMTAINKPLFSLLFTDSYAEGAVAMPYLFIAPLLLMLFQVAGNQFVVIKKTWPNPIILGVGAIANIVVNYLLISKIGIEGAALGTLMGYVVSIILIVLLLRKINLLKISKKFIVITAITIIYYIGWRFVFSQNILVSLLFAFIGIVLILGLYLPSFMSKIKETK